MGRLKFSFQSTGPLGGIGPKSYVEILGHYSALRHCLLEESCVVVLGHLGRLIGRVLIVPRLCMWDVIFAFRFDLFPPSRKSLFILPEILRRSFISR